MVSTDNPKNEGGIACDPRLSRTVAGSALATAADAGGYATAGAGRARTAAASAAAGRPRRPIAPAAAKLPQRSQAMLRAPQSM